MRKMILIRIMIIGTLMSGALLNAWAIRFCGSAGYPYSTPPLYLYSVDANGNPSKIYTLQNDQAVSNTDNKGPYKISISNTPQAFVQNFTIDNDSQLYVVPCIYAADGYAVLSAPLGCDVTKTSGNCESSCFGQWQYYTGYLAPTEDPTQAYCQGASQGQAIVPLIHFINH
jgi:hypothetical protein